MLLANLYWAWVFAMVVSFRCVQGDQAVDAVLCKGICNYPTAMCIDPVTRNLFISDTANNRVLRFGLVDSLTNESLPLVAFGQPDLSSTSSNRGSLNDQPSASSLSWPTGIFVDSTGTLWVADSGNHRVLWWENAATRASGAPADGILGQSNFTNGSPVAYFSANNMISPRALWMDEQGRSLWVADSGDSRILRYDDPTSKRAGAPADGLLGHSNLLEFGAGYGAGRLSSPSGLQGVPGGGLIVSDRGNNRVLYFSEANAFTNGGVASFVFGQPDLDSPYSYPVSNLSVSGPRGIVVAGSYVLVSTIENRVLMFENGIDPSTNFLEAVGVLGQSDFTSQGHGNSDTQLYMPHGLFFDKATNKLWVADAGNHRIVRFPFIVLESQNRSGLMLQAAFQGRSPNVHVLPQDGSGNTQLGEKEVFMKLEAIEEVNPSGTVLASLQIPSTGYTANTSVDGEVQTFNFHLGRPPHLDISYSLFPEGETLSSAGLVFTTEPSTLKLTINIGSWPFADPSNELVFHLSLRPYPAVKSIQQYEGGNQTAFVLQSSTISATLSLLGSAIADGNVVPVRFSLSKLSGGLLDLSLRFPSYTSWLQYDPDLSVTLRDPDNEESTGPGLYPLLTLLALLFPVAFVLIGIIALVVVVVNRRRMRRRLTYAQGSLVIPSEDDEHEDML